jgi:hypothetical protein
MQSVGYLFSSLFVVGTSIGFFAATVALLPNRKLNILEGMLWAVFLIWQLAPVLFEGYSPGLNFREVARYPVSMRLYFFLNAAYGIFDPAALTGLCWLFTIWLGIVYVRAEWALPAALAFVVFAAFNVVCNRIVIGLFERFQSTRKGRERMVALLLLLALLPQMANFMANGWIDVKRFHPPAWAREVFSGLLQVSPPGLVSQTVTQPGMEKLLPAAVLLAYLMLAAWLQVRNLRKVYQGEIYAETVVVKRDLKIKPGWRLPLVDEAVSAIFEKEMRYLRQNSRLIVQLLYPLILFAFMSLGSSGRRLPFFSSGGGMLGPFAALMALSVSNLSYNTFGMDREGFGRWLLSPLSLRKVFIAKSLTQGAVMSGCFLLGATIIVTIRHVSWDMLAAVIAGFLCVLIIQIGAGNVISVYWPRRIDLTQMSSRMTSNAAGFASLAVNLPLIAIIGGVVLATWLLHLTWLPLAAGVTGLALSIFLYSRLLNWAVRYANEHLEEIATQLGV